MKLFSRIFHFSIPFKDFPNSPLTIFIPKIKKKIVFLITFEKKLILAQGIHFVTLGNIKEFELKTTCTNEIISSKQFLVLRPKNKPIFFKEMFYVLIHFLIEWKTIKKIFFTFSDHQVYMK